MCWNLVQIQLHNVVDSLTKRIDEMIVVENDTVSPIEMKSNIQTMLRKESRWLEPLIGQANRDRLVNRWQYKIDHRNIQTQTDLMPIRKNISTNTIDYYLRKAPIYHNYHSLELNNTTPSIGIKNEFKLPNHVRKLGLSPVIDTFVFEKD